ncbi:hypothetical protein PZ938_03485 [Luteipulveratus sp. YIM 133132]|uniref:Uncharacterized protein n=1 Tax=Luteipulveratus flavus TaxID=3031728 RepID=A0ABT6C1Q7_9MICO|nr:MULTISPECIES: hypothetical protein [unclassified Luteipulveratus]MDE9364656.1 hypothetical protein [Luteipulveratus sp. YIM 133132]MDF8262816.1 hypothetical protein [Luteipulveratus sp. YIM 133296]
MRAVYLTAAILVVIGGALSIVTGVIDDDVTMLVLGFVGLILGSTYAARYLSIKPGRKS